MSKVVIIGGGAAGMLAAVYAGRRGHEVHLFEKNQRLGKKLYITGKGRCNLTNACTTEELFAAVVSNPKFLYSAFYSYPSQAVMDFFKEAGVSLKVERGNRVFPVSDHSSDIIKALESQLKQAHVEVHLGAEVKKIFVLEGRTEGILLENGTRVAADAVVTATGGLSYPSTGSTGDGYRFARECGHRVSQLLPSLVPLKAQEAFIPRLQGLSLRNTGLFVYDGRRKVYEDFGEMMFTQDGVTGPMILSASAVLGRLLEKKSLQAYLDLKPVLSEEQLDARILREFEAGKNKQLKNVIGSLYPSSLTPVVIELSQIPGEKQIHEISREERRALVQVTKRFPITLVGVGGFKEAVITKGGVSVREIQPGTMESRKVKGLYFIGEVLDLDALTGGYNLQIAWSTAYLAAMAIE